MGLSENMVRSSTRWLSSFPNTIATNEGEGRYTRTPFSDTPKCHIKWVISYLDIPIERWVLFPLITSRQNGFFKDSAAFLGRWRCSLASGSGRDIASATPSSLPTSWPLTSTTNAKAGIPIEGLVLALVLVDEWNTPTG